MYRLQQLQRLLGTAQGEERENFRALTARLVEAISSSPANN